MSTCRVILDFTHFKPHVLARRNSHQQLVLELNKLTIFRRVKVQGIKDWNPINSNYAQILALLFQRGERVWVSEIRHEIPDMCAFSSDFIRFLGEDPWGAVYVSITQTTKKGNFN